MQRKLAVANCTLCETVECRDARIQELETMLCNKQQEVLTISNRTEGLFLCHRSCTYMRFRHFFKTPTHKKIKFFKRKSKPVFMKLVLQVQENQQQLQDLELSMDLKESRVRKLEYELKLLSGTSLHLFSCAGNQVDETSCLRD